MVKITKILFLLKKLNVWKKMLSKTKYENIYEHSLLGLSDINTVKGRDIDELKITIKWDAIKKLFENTILEIWSFINFWYY